MKNWKTTLAGVLFALCTIGQNVSNLLTAGTPINWGQIGLSAIVAVGLLLAKDFNVTGNGKDATAKTSGTVVALLFVGFSSLTATGCGGALHDNIQKVIVAENLVKGEEQILEVAIEAQIPLLPPDQQASVRAELAAIETKIGQAIVVKDTALQTALDASNSTIDFNKLMADILNLIPELIALATKVKVSEQTVQQASMHLQVQKARYVR